MILIGMFDSPFVRRVAISLSLLDLPFEHRDWSVGKDAELIRAYNPLGRVPVLVLDDGEALIESAMILDHLDEQVGPGRALLSARGQARRHALKLIALALGAVEKGLQIVVERVFRPEDLRHAPWVERCARQVDGALAALEAAVAPVGDAWLGGDRIGQVDITLGCVLTYLRDAARFDLARYPALAARSARYEAMPVFQRHYRPFDAPVPT
jgi:glutathione S-transferase